MVVAVGQIMHGAARAMLNPSDEAVAEMRAALAAYRATGARFQSTSHLILLAQALTACGRHDEGLSALREAEVLVDETGERYLEAEIHRLQGNLLLARGGSDRAVEASYSKALEVSRAQEARPNCAPPPIWLGCGLDEATAPGRRISSRRFAVGSQKVSIPPTSKRLGLCLRSCRKAP